MTRTRPHSTALARTVDPAVREYTAAVVDEALRPLRDRLTNIEAAISNLRAEIDFHAATATARLNDIDTVLSLTAYRAARVRQLLEQIEEDRAP